MEGDYSSVALLEALLALLVYTIPELRYSREAAVFAAEAPNFVPLPTRLWRLVAIIGMASYTATIVTHATGFLEVGPKETGEQTLRFVGGVLLGTPYFFLSAVALGASWKDLADRTLAWALVMALLVAGPLAAAAPSLAQLRLPPLWKGPPGESPILRYRALGCCLGAWVGAVVIPLDWAMPFQEWPLPLVVGAVLGHNLGSLAFYFHERHLEAARRVHFE